MTLTRAVLSSVFALGALLPVGATGQAPLPEPIPLSQYGFVGQRLGPATISVEYRRPVARGREIFGNLVAYDEPWTPAADSAAVLTLSEDLELAGTPVNAGDYSLWFIPRAGGEPWTVILSSADRVFHAPYPEGRDAHRIDIRPGTAPHVETLQFSFPRVEGSQAILLFQWGETTLPIPLTLPGRDSPQD